VHLTVLPVETDRDIASAAASLTADRADAILMVPAAPIRQAMKHLLYPVSIAEGVPIVSYERTDLARGAAMSYAGSRHANAAQAARMVDRVLRGTDPADIPVETPQKLELVFNRLVVERLDLDLPDETWDLADEVVEIEVE
jgi:putative ABC transport system substrate-binding protein